ncbi:TetR/AcrR family transcriptional regulator [Angustibacter peucedani]
MTPRAPSLPPDERRAALVAATLPLVRQRGGAVSTREIAEAAGVAEGTIFRAFGSKDELLQACVQEAFDTVGVVATLRGIDADLPLQPRLTAAVTVLQQHLDGVFSLLMTLRSSGQPIGGPRRVSGTDHGRRAEQQLERALVDLVGDDARDLRVEPDRLLDFLRMLTLSSVHPMMARSTATADEIVDVVLNGLLSTTHRTPRGA